MLHHNHGSMQYPIVSKFYKQIFCTKVFCTVFIYLHFGVVFFWRNNIDTYAACKMLMKLTTGSNFFKPHSKEQSFLHHFQTNQI